MPMVQSKLATQLLSLSTAPSSTEVAAIQAFANAYATFATDASAAVPITPAGVALGQAAMIAAMPGVSAPGAGPVIITQAVIAFWTAAAAGLAVSFVGATAITPPPHAGLLQGLITVGAQNVASEADAPTATNAIAAVFYSQAIIGGTVTIAAVPSPII